MWPRYPGTYAKGTEIGGVEKAEAAGVTVFHAGTRREGARPGLGREAWECGGGGRCGKKGCSAEGGCGGKKVAVPGACGKGYSTAKRNVKIVWFS